MKPNKTYIIIAIVIMIAALGALVYFLKPATFLGGTIPTQAECTDYAISSWCSSGYHCKPCYQYTAVNGARAWSTDCFYGTSGIAQLNGATDICSSTVCIVGDQRCSSDNSKVERCRATTDNKNEWYTYSTCSSTQWCPAAHSSCENKPVETCTPNAMRCVGVDLQFCGSGGTWFSQGTSSCSDTTARCIPGTNDLCADTIIANGYYYCKVPVTTCSSGCASNACVNPIVCTANVKECVSPSQYRQCNSAGTAWMSDVTCPSSTPTCSGAGNCILNQICTPGAVRCSGTATKETCNSAGTAWTQLSCISPQECANGQCVNTISCAPNAAECVGTNAYRQCNSLGNGYLSTVQCSSGQSCTLGQCLTPPQCTIANQATACNDNNACTTDTCNGISCLNTPIVCPTGLSCVGGSCVAPPSCTIANAATVCNDGNPCTEDTCPASNCVYTPITTGSCAENNQTVCKAYQTLSTSTQTQPSECKFSISKLFTGSGFQEYYSDNTAMFWVILLGIILLIILLIWFISSRGSSPNSLY